MKKKSFTVNKLAIKVIQRQTRQQRLVMWESCSFEKLYSKANAFLWTIIVINSKGIDSTYVSYEKNNNLILEYNK